MKRQALTPEQRVDKNGHLVTRHVRSSINNNTKVLPAPELGKRSSTAKKFEPSEKQTQNGFYALNWHLYAPDQDVIRILELDLNDYVRFTANQVGLSDVLSVTSPDNALALLSRGIENSADAIEFFKGQGLDHLIKDNSWEAEQLIQRKIDPLSYAEICAKDRGDHASPRWRVDAAEAHSKKALRDWQRSPSVPIRVLDGAINYADIKTVGVTRLVRADPKGSSLVPTLVRMNKGELNYDAAGLRKIVDHHVSEQRPGSDMTGILSLAEAVDVDFALTIASPQHALEILRDMKRQRAVNVKEVVSYGDQIYRYQKSQGHRASPRPADIRELYEAGVSAEVAADGFHEGHTVNQIKAIATEGIAPSVSGGWL